MFGRKNRDSRIDDNLGSARGMGTTGPTCVEPEIVAEFDTGLMILRDVAVVKEAFFEEKIPFLRTMFSPGVVYFRAGTEINWDFVQIPLRGKPRFFKRQRDIEVDKDGNVTEAEIRGATGMSGFDESMTATATIPGAVLAPAKKRVRSAVKKTAPRRR